MIIEKSVTLSADDTDKILDVARILEEVSTDSMCWTAKTMRNLANGKFECTPVSDYVTIDFE